MEGTIPSLPSMPSVPSFGYEEAAPPVIENTRVTSAADTRTTSTGDTRVTLE